MNKPEPKLDIRPYRARGNEAEQEWFFLSYPGEFSSYNGRMTILRRYCADGDTWFGVRVQFPDTHETAIGMMCDELKLAQQAIKVLKKNWKKYLQNID